MCNHPSRVIRKENCNMCNFDQEPNIQKQIKWKQMRLLLFRHASKCHHKKGECPVTSLCWNMKLLWKHINDCKDPLCEEKHCKSSKRLMKHYIKCADMRCIVCAPVKKTFKKELGAKVHKTCLSTIEE